jgi:hypothetical protein
VDRVKKVPCRCLFAFISYKHKESLSAIALLHSLIVQLVLDDRDLQMILCKSFQSNKANLKGSPKYSREILSKLLRCAGFTFIIIDGLDETEESERRVILSELLEVLKDCSEVKLCFSSRAEHDISKTLKAAAEVIRVDSNNAGCIQAYVTNRIQNWFSEQADLDPNARLEIESLLAPLSAKANGEWGLFHSIILQT